jgi:hypothetical protein
MFRRVALAAIAVGLCTPLLPAQAAKSTTLFFANPGDATFTPVLQTTPDAQFHESSQSVVVQGTGSSSGDDVYISNSKLSFKVDVTRKVTGTVYAMCQQVIGANTATQRNAGYVDLSVAVKLDGTKIGSVALSGPIAPTMTISAPFTFPIPASLKNKTVKKVAAYISWNTTVGACAISYSDPGQSQIVVPVR